MKIILIIFIVLIIALILISYYYGIFEKLEIKIKKAGGETVVYEEIKGEYRQSGIVMDKIYYSLLNIEKITTYKGYGTYYDNPKTTKTEELRSEAGSILEEKDQDKIEKLKEKYSIKQIQEEEYITTEFPFKNKLSIFYSIIRVYPTLEKYCIENNYDVNTPVTEIYDIPNKKIIYLKKILKK